MGVFRAGSGRGEGSVKGLGHNIIDSSHSETSNAGHRVPCRRDYHFCVVLNPTCLKSRQKR